MSLRRIPAIPTLLVLAAVALMVRLGFWQLDRLHQKEALLAQYQAAASNPEPLASLPMNTDWSVLLYRRVKVFCAEVRGWRSISGKSLGGEAGISHMALCRLGDRFALDGPGYDIAVAIGWSRDPKDPTWSGGEVSGTIAPFQKGEVRVVADPPLAGLDANARPDPKDVPNNHLSYATQWFLFAATALVIYAIALRKRLNQS